MRFATFLAVTTAATFALAPSASAQDVTADFFGRVMLDQTFASADEADVDFNTSDARRLRIGVKGNFSSDIKYKFELNTDSSGEINAEDAFIQWAPTGDSWSVIIGQDNTHNSFDELSSSLFIPFAERSWLTDTFQLDRRLGVSVVNKGDNWTAALGVHTVNLENSGDEEGWAASGRVTGTPINNEDLLVHLGASFRYRDQGDGDSALRYRQRPMSASLNRIVSTGNVADEDMFYGLEAVASLQNGAYWLATEYSVTNADLTEDVALTALNDDASFSGAYLTAGTMLGGRRTYKDGVWKRPEVDNPVGEGGYGALMLEARYDDLDLTDNGVDGGALESFSAVAGWWMTDRVLLSATGFTSDAELGTSTSGLGSEFASLVTAGVQQEDVSGVLFRAQFDF
jgi:phosphate-selective porin OprO/OprP